MPFTIDTVGLVEETGGDTRTGRTYVRTYELKYSGGLYSSSAILRSTDERLPKPGQAHDTDTLAFVDSRSVKLKEQSDPGAGIAVLTVNYRYPENGLTWSLNPWDRPAVIRGEAGDLTEVRLYDRDGQPIINSAGDYYDDIPAQVIPSASIVVERFERHNPVARAVEFSYTTNASAWYGVAAGNGLLGKITFSEVREIVSGVAMLFYAVQYPITFRNDGWMLKLIDSGYVLKDGSGNRRSKTDDLGTPTPTPVLLDGAGDELGEGLEPVFFPPEGYRIKDATNWSTLALPDVFADGSP